jgi:hypothetical protein
LIFVGRERENVFGRSVIDHDWIDSGKYTIFLASDYSQADILKRAYSLALPRVFGPVNLAVSIEELLVSPDVYKLPGDSIKELAEKLVSFDLAKTAGSREIVTFDWPTSNGAFAYRINHPARGISCKHAQCFDLEVCTFS